MASSSLVRALPLFLALPLGSYGSDRNERDFDFSAAWQLPVQTRPTPAEIDLMDGLHPLQQALYADTVLLRGIRYLLPARFRVASGTMFQPVIDEAILQL